MILAKNIDKSFGEVEVIKDFNIDIKKGEFVCIAGPSGSGKTTILNILGLLEKPTSGEVEIEEQINPRGRATLLIQRHKFGYLFQNYALIENETVESNLKIALEYREKIDKNEEVARVLEKVGLADFQKKKVFELSGGEQQRIALARVMLKECDYIFADEPTGNLDEDNRNIVFGILEELNKSGKTIVLVTHDKALIEKVDRIVELKDIKKN